MVKAIAPAPAGLVLRPFAPTDFRVLQSWFQNEDEARLWGGPAVRFPVDDVQLEAMLGEALGPDARRRCWSALLAGEAVGHAQAVRESERSVRLARIAVAPQRRGHGLGRTLISKVIDEILSDPSVAQVALNVYADNERARRLYRELGFIDAGAARRSTAQDGRALESRPMMLDRSRWA